MDQYNIGAMPVINQNNTVIGIISERDIARQISKKNFRTDIKVEELMTKDVISCDLNISVSELMETMTTNKIRHMLIMDKQKLLGVVSIGDVVSHIIEQYKEENENLRNYINNF
jgi:CBS domain-containing protein